MGTMTSRMQALATAAVAVLGVTAAGFTGQQAAAAHAGESGLLILAEFADASPILVGNDVKIDGVPIGEVAALEVVDGRALVTVFLQPEALPVHQDARLTIKPVSMLGERYVDLERGTPESPAMADGDLLPLASTATNTDLDQVLNAFDDPTGEALAMMVTTLGQAVDGNGAEADATIRALGPAMQDTRTLAAVLSDQRDLVADMVDTLEPVVGAVAADDGQRMDALLSTTRTLLAATADEQKRLEDLLAELPATLTTAEATLGRVSAAAEETTPTLRELRPTVDQLSELSRELYDFADALDPALAATEPVLKRGRELLDQLAPVAKALRPAGDDLRATAAGARPLVDELAGRADDVYDFIRFWAMTANGHDALSSYFRGFVVMNPQSGTWLMPAGLPAPPLPGATEEQTAQPPGPPDLPAAGGGLLSPDATDPSGGVTGMNEEQEQGLTGLLFGGGS